MEWNFLSRSKSQSGKSTASSSKKPDYGLHTIVDRDSAATEAIDIIAIHGLNGDYLRTWTDEATGTNWLKDHVTRIVPASRVMSFSYNSKLQFSKSTSDVLDFGDQLLECLLAERETVEESQRPLIFICHSLGGLVFKQAYLRALDSEKYMFLAKYINGVFFFGTPHKGSSLANWSTKTARLLRMASLGTSTNAQLSIDLEPNSRLTQISRSFLDRCSGLHIVSCYETRKMDFLNALVVERESAILGLEAEIKIPIESDHRGICRFGDFNEKRFKVVKSRLDAMARTARTSTFLEMDSLMRALDTSNYEAHKSRNPSPVEGTCTWILEKPAYKAWLESASSFLLWMSADPGCGKSVLASFLIDHIMKTSRGDKTNVCYFFFKSDNLEQSEVATGIRAILHQLYGQQQNLASYAASQLRGGNLEAVETLWKAFISSIEHKDANPTICILDGLDECEPQSRGVLLRCITNYFEAQEGASNKVGQKPQLRLFISSRYENQIKVALDKPRKSTNNLASRKTSKPYSMIRLRAEDETGAISSDISKVVAAKIEDLIDRGLPVGLLQNLQDELVKRADRTFLWVSLVISLLEEKVENGASRRELDDIVRTRSIYSVYAALLASRPDLPKARKMLNLVLAATRPLTVEETSIALAVVPEEDNLRDTPAEKRPKLPGRLSFDDVEYELVYPYENHIKHLCGHFVRIIRNKVYLVHETAREFLLAENKPRHAAASQENTEAADEGLCTYSLEFQPETFQHTFSLAGANAILLEICVAFLYCLAKPSKSSQPGETSPEVKEFLSYAAQSWTIHHHRARRWLDERDSRYYQNLCHPLFPGFVRWIEEFWHPKGPLHIPGAPDDVQDYYIDFFNLDIPPSLSYDSTDRQDNSDVSGSELSEGEGSEVSEEAQEAGGMACGYGRTGERRDEVARLSVPSRRDVEASLSSNPGSLSNYYFPLTVDENGLVSLKFEPGRAGGPPENGR
ncbi:Putative P-loop containing nucleoside triphosphate hydrolase, alpha/Beta hydrolase [Colletotrichum destructivum]|uniref:P-loop containing nucleoside triphosphate hydrolase, alpha/Beta hydrolase n=1 Tax=Colletotrichum destructivum TaxID=34406 RepID=A0AAX4J0H3_9PEZI|nr:Putative P-loop containing nucleoside triphosphate hydrolase, alpha/Beta hydrolase [Colletotrichum destructivum]